MGVYGAQALGVGQLAPDALKNHITIERRAPVAHQQFQQVKLPPPQVQRLAVLPGHPVHRIQHDIIGPQLPPAAAGAAQHRFHPGDELFRREGLGDIIIRAQPQAQHPILHRAFRRDEDDRHALGPQALQQGVTVQPGQHNIQQRHIEVVFLDQIRRRAAILGHGAGVPGAGQCHLDEPRDQVLILGNQYVVHGAE